MSRAAELLRSLLDGVGRGFPAELADLYADDAVATIVFQPGEDVTVVGRETIRERFAAAAGRPFRMVVGDLVIHETEDPHLAIGEYTYEWTVLATGRTFSTRNIQVIVEHDGLIAATRDYHDHVRIAAGLRPPTDAAALASRMQEIFNAAQFDRADEVFAVGFVSHPLGTTGRETVVERWSAMHASDPSIRVVAGSMIAQGDTFAIRSRAFGDATPARELYEFGRVADGRIQEIWGASREVQ